MDRLRRQHGRELIGGALVIAALIAIAVGYANIRDEADVAIQLPYVLTGGICARRTTRRSWPGWPTSRPRTSRCGTGSTT
jgi:hypothetical protein